METGAAAAAAVLLMGVIGLHRTHTHTHTHTLSLQGLKIEGWPEQLPLSDIDLYLMTPRRRNERGARSHFLGSGGVDASRLHHRLDSAPKAQLVLIKSSLVRLYLNVAAP